MNFYKYIYIYNQAKEDAVERRHKKRMKESQKRTIQVLELEREKIKATCSSRTLISRMKKKKDKDSKRKKKKSKDAKKKIKKDKDSRHKIRVNILSQRKRRLPKKRRMTFPIVKRGLKIPTRKRTKDSDPEEKTEDSN